MYRGNDGLINLADKQKSRLERGRGFDLLGSGGWIRTSDQLINSQLRYHCATPEWSSDA